MTQRLDFYHLPEDQKALTHQDCNVMRTLRTNLKLDHLETFSSDMLRLYGLDRFFPDKAHGIGGFFARLKANGKALEVGWIRSTFPSNHGRMIREYKFTEN
jgi:hypothetical protein